MTENEAKEYLSNKYLVVGSPANPPKEECEKHNAVLDMAIEALDKQIPKKVKGKHISYCVEERKMCGEDTLYGNCPNCGELVSSLWNDENCGDCGQALDWND